MPIRDKTNNIFTYYPIPKNGSTSIKRWIYDYFCSVSLEFKGRYGCEGRTLVHNIFPTPKKDGGHIGPKHKPTFKFAVIRDPILRFISAYKSRVLSQQCLYDFKDQLGKKGLGSMPSINEYIKNFEDYKSICKEIAHHSTLQHVFIGNVLTGMNKVYDIYNMSELEQDLQNITGYDVAFKHPNMCSSKCEIEELTIESKCFLLSYTDRDYTMLESANIKFNKYSW